MHTGKLSSSSRTWMYDFKRFNWLTCLGHIASSIKVFAIVGLIILGIVLDLGGGPNHDRQEEFIPDTVPQILTFVPESVSVTGNILARSFSTMTFPEPLAGSSHGGASSPKLLSPSLEQRLSL